MELSKLQQLAGSRSPDDYPEANNLLDLMVAEVKDQLSVNPKSTPEHLVASVLAGLTLADVRGHISVGDEHEWATLSLMATERAWS